MTRADILEKANQCVNGSRDNDYGSPEDNFLTIARLWTTYLGCRKTMVISAEDVAAMMALMKIARIANGAPKTDNWIDLAGYAACGGEIESRRQKTDISESEAISDDDRRAQQDSGSC